MFPCSKGNGYKSYIPGSAVNHTSHKTKGCSKALLLQTKEDFCLSLFVPFLQILVRLCLLITQNKPLKLLLPAGGELLQASLSATCRTVGNQLELWATHEPDFDKED